MLSCVLWVLLRYSAQERASRLVLETLRDTTAEELRAKQEQLEAAQKRARAEERQRLLAEQARREAKLAEISRKVQQAKELERKLRERQEEERLRQREAEEAAAARKEAEDEEDARRQREREEEEERERQHETEPVSARVEATTKAPQKRETVRQLVLLIDETSFLVLSAAFFVFSHRTDTIIAARDDSRQFLCLHQASYKDGSLSAQYDRRRCVTTLEFSPCHSCL